MSAERDEFAALKAVAHARRAAERDEATWLSHAAGEASAEQIEALNEKAKTDPYHAHMTTLTAPASAAQLDAIAQRVSALQAQPPSPPNVVTLTQAKRPVRRLGLIMSGIAAAAAVLLFVTTPRTTSQPLPPFEAELSGVDAPVRSALAGRQESSRKKLSRGARIDLQARPLEPISADARIGGSLFLVQNQSVVPLSIPMKVSEQGALRVVTDYQTLVGERTGAWDLIWFVGHPDALPRTEAEARSQLQKPAEDLRVLRFALTLEP